MNVCAADDSVSGDNDQIDDCKENSMVDKVESRDVNEGEKVFEGDEYDYLQRNLFSSEIFKLEIRNLPKYFGIGELKKLLTKKLGFNLRKIKLVGRKRQLVYVCFDSKDEQTKALNVLNDYNWKNSLLKVKIGDPAPDPLVKRKLEEDSESGKRPKFSSVEEMKLAIKESVMPWHNISYSEQLENKTKLAEQIITKFGYDVLSVNPHPKAKQYITNMKTLNQGLPCKFFPCKGLEDHCNHYRNKCEFSVGENALNGEKTVGFRLGTYSSGSVGIAPIDHLSLVNPRMYSAVELFQMFVRSSDLIPFSPATHKGHWGHLTVRMGMVSDELMLIIGLHSLNCTEEMIEDVKVKLKEYFTDGDGKSLNATSLYLQMIHRRKPGSIIPNPELLYGQPHISETLCGLKFRISPLSFFQVNTKCAEIMIEEVKKLAKVDKETTILDVCCGTGVLGLCLAKDCAQVVGVELEQQSVNDAKTNALENGISNCEFYCGSANEIINSVVSHIKSDNIVAIVDPPRAGLQKGAIKMLRKTERIKKIVFLSCDARLSFPNFLDLCKAESKSMEGSPFYLVSATPVDMFPLTNKYELVLYFERESMIEDFSQQVV